MYGSGVLIGIRMIIIKRVRPGTRKALLMASIVFSAAVVGSIPSPNVGLPIAFGMKRTSTVALLAFALPGIASKVRGNELEFLRREVDAKAKLDKTS